MCFHTKVCIKYRPSILNDIVISNYKIKCVLLLFIQQSMFRLWLCYLYKQFGKSHSINTAVKISSVMQLCTPHSICIFQVFWNSWFTTIICMLLFGSGLVPINNPHIFYLSFIVLDASTTGNTLNTKSNNFYCHNFLLIGIHCSYSYF